jgi:Peptidase propeptide and YPEB domain
MKGLHGILIMAFAWAVPLSASAKDRAANAEEAAAIGEVLKAAGFTEWEVIRFDDDRVWEVKEAKKADGTVHNVMLDEALKITEVEEDLD